MGSVKHIHNRQIRFILFMPPGSAQTMDANAKKAQSQFLSLIHFFGFPLRLFIRFHIIYMYIFAMFSHGCSRAIATL